MFIDLRVIQLEIRDGPPIADHDTWRDCVALEETQSRYSLLHSTHMCRETVRRFSTSFFLGTFVFLHLSTFSHRTRLWVGIILWSLNLFDFWPTFWSSTANSIQNEVSSTSGLKESSSCVMIDLRPELQDVSAVAHRMRFSSHRRSATLYSLWIQRHIITSSVSSHQSLRCMSISARLSRLLNYSSFPFPAHTTTSYYLQDQMSLSQFVILISNQVFDNEKRSFDFFQITIIIDTSSQRRRKKFFSTHYSLSSKNFVVQIYED